MQYMQFTKVYDDKKNQLINEEYEQLLKDHIDSLSINRVLHDCYGPITDTTTSCPLSPDLAFAKHQLNSLFKKFNDGSNKANSLRKDAAYKKFLQAELSCKDWNDSKFNALNAAACEFLVRVAKRIERMLGPVPTYDRLDFQFGPGSSSNCTQTNVRYKLDSTPAVSKVSAIQDAYAFLDTAPLFAYFHKGKVDVIPARLTFVPKNKDIDRPIIIEPSLNTVVQKGIGSYIRTILLKNGVDLRHGQLKNKSLAREASFTGSLATIDLSSASDRIPYRLIYELLPSDWFSLLNKWRSTHVTVPLELRSIANSQRFHSLKLNKFSSMGNGFTFELETLVFYAIVLESVAKERRSLVAIYGDDIICHVNDYDSVVSHLAICNFETNSKKSFTGELLFRESCGGDYYSGFDVTPFYQKKKWSSICVVKLLNHLRYKSHDLFQISFNFFSKHFDLRFDSGPLGYGLGYYQVRNFRKPSISNDLSGFFFFAFSFRPLKIPKFVMRSDEIYPFYVAMSSTGEEGSVSDPYSTRGTHNYKIDRKRIYIL